MELDPQTMGLLSAAFGGLQASGPSRTPVSLGQVIGQAGQAGLGGYQQGIQNQRQGILIQAQMAELERKKKQEQQLQEFAAQLPEAERAAFLVNPGEYIKERNKKYTVGNALVGADGKPVYQAPDRYTMSPGQVRVQDGNIVAELPQAPSLVELPVPGQPGVLQKAWLRPGETQGAAVGGFKMPEILNPEVQRARRDIAKAGATNVAVQTDNLGLKPKDRFSMETELGDKYTKATEFDSKILNATTKLRQVLSGDPNAMKDQAAIYGFAKVLDPDGAVRESDYAAVTNTAGLADKVKNYLNKIATGQMLSATQREEMTGVLEQWEKMANSRISEKQARFSDQARQYNLSPKNVVGDPPKNSAPKPIKNFTDKDLRETAMKYGISVSEVKKRLGLED